MSGWGDGLLARDSEEGLDVVGELQDVEGFGPERHMVEFLQVTNLVGALVSDQNDRTSLGHFHVRDQTAEPAAIHRGSFDDDDIGEGSGAHQESGDIGGVKDHLGCGATLGQDHIGQHFMSSAFQSVGH